MYKPTLCEIQSNLSRVRHAELLIAQLPENHDGRNTWLMNYGVGDEAKTLRNTRSVGWVRETEAAQTIGGSDL